MTVALPEFFGALCNLVIRSRDVNQLSKWSSR